MTELTHSATAWAQRIRDRWQDTVLGVIDCGRMLVEAKGELPHGEFTAMVKRGLPFGVRAAQRLMAIAQDNRLSNTTHVSCLPSSWGTLYELTKLDDGCWSRALEDGLIRADMQRQDVAKLRQLTTPDESPAASVDGCTVDDLASLQGERFGTVYADPPWLYGNQATRAATSNHYGGMSVDAIAALPVAELAADNAHLHLWTTNGFLFESRAIMEAWGFTYKSCLVWVKPSMGIGNYWRVSHEFLLLGVRGSCPFASKSEMSWLQADRSAHSEKPERVREAIERVSPGPRLELFGRRQAPGWVVWGNEIERSLFDVAKQAVA